MLTATKAYRRTAIQSQRDKLIEEHLWLVRTIVGRMAVRLPAGVDVENLESAGTLGLVEAANKFDASRGIQFKTYADRRIRGAVLDELRRNSPLSQQMLEQVKRVRKAHQQFQETPVSVEQLAKVTGLTTDEVADVLAAMRFQEMVSWDEATEAPSRYGPQSMMPDAAMQQTEQKELLAEAIQSLPERERLMVTLYYLEGLRLREIGEVTQLSESRVSRLVNSGLFHIREFMKARENN